MSRLRSNCSDDLADAERARRVHRRQRRDLAELPLQRRGDQRGDHVGARAGQLRRHLHGREIDLRQRGDRQREIAERAANQQRDAEQRGRDRPADEGFGDTHEMRLPLRRLLPGSWLLGSRSRLFSPRPRRRAGLALLVTLAAAPLGAAVLALDVLLPILLTVLGLTVLLLAIRMRACACAGRDRPTASARRGR